MLHPLVKLVDWGVIEGKGLVATGLIRAGEVVSRLDPDQPMVAISELLTWPDERRETYFVHAYQCSATHYVAENGIDKHMNHSCDPNTWWIDNDTMVARRDIQPGDEITYDYATTEIALDFEMTCLCGTEACRGLITNRDYQRPDWQARFGDHLPEHTREAIARYNASRASEPAAD
jgi:SET domain-containing protein